MTERDKHFAKAVDEIVEGIEIAFKNYQKTQQNKTKQAG